MAYRNDAENQVVVVSVNQDTGERVFSGLHHFGSEPLQVAELDDAYIKSASYLHLDGTHPEAARQAAQWMHAAGKKVSLDCAKSDGKSIWGELRELAPYVDILICGSGFGRALTGHTDLWWVGEAILALGPQIVVQTEGKNGSYTFTPEARFHTPAFQVNVTDTTGAGDVFHGAYLVGLLHGWDVQSVVFFFCDNCLGHQMHSTWWTEGHPHIRANSRLFASARVSYHLKTGVNNYAFNFNWSSAETCSSRTFRYPAL